MKNKFKKLSESEVASIIDNCVSQSNNAWNTELSYERETAYKYYTGELPAASATSKFVSRDLFDSVEGLKAVLLEAFSTGRRIAQFNPTGPDDVEHARIATEYCSYVMFRQNDGYKLFQDAMQDGVMSRVAVVKYWWEKKIERVPYEFENSPQTQYDLMVADDETELDMDTVTETVDDATGVSTFSGTVYRLVDASYPKVAVLPPEEFLISPYATSIEDANYVIHQTEMSISDLLGMGYKMSELEDIGSNSSMNMSSELQTRWMDVSNNIGEAGDYQDQTRNILTHEVYIHLDMDGKGVTKLWRIFKVGSVILDMEEVNEKPFVSFVPMPTPHRFYGESYPDLVIPIQNAKTTLIRGILDHTVITNTPRYMVQAGALISPRELLESRVGGLVNVNDMDGIRPLPQGSLNPFVFQTLGLMDQSKEDSTGLSRLSQGMNKDAVSKQNSAAMVENLVALSQQRQKIIARNFGECFLKPLYAAVYRLAAIKERRQTFQDVTGNFVEVDPSKFYDLKNVTIDLALGYGEREREAQKYLALNDYMSKPENAALFNPMNRYNTVRRALAMMDITDPDNFIMHPSQIQPSGPDPVVMAQLELAKGQLKVQERQVELGMLNAQLDNKYKMEELKLKTQETGSKIAMNAQRQKLEEERFHAKVEMDQAELDMLQATPEDQLNSIISLN